MSISVRTDLIASLDARFLQIIALKDFSRGADLFNEASQVLTLRNFIELN